MPSRARTQAWGLSFLLFMGATMAGAIAFLIKGMGDGARAALWVTVVVLLTAAAVPLFRKPRSEERGS